jgi:2-dehydropantoate 2-reductase
VLGVGGVGGLVGAALARAGEEVTLLMRAESLASYSGVMRVDSTVLGDFVVTAPARPQLTDAVDVLWVTPKATQLEPALTLAPADVVNDGRVVTLMNGVDHLRLLQQRYRNVVGGAMRVESERVEPGHIRQTSPFIRVELSDGQDIVDVLLRAGMDAQVGPDALTILWRKLAFLAPMALATTAYDETLGQAREREEFQRCQAEAVAVADAEGAAVDLDALRTLTSGAPREMRSSMQKDKAKGLPLELDAIAGPIVRGGRAHRIDTPATEYLTERVVSR